MSRGRAPTALRRPISRVRSRTETSMMLETPTPPTSREMPGDRGQHAGQHAQDVAEHAEDLLLGDRAELGVRVPARQLGDDPLAEVVDAVAVGRLDRERVDARRCRTAAARR